MSADDLIQFVSQVLYLAIFARVVLQAARRPTRTHVDVALLFGATSLVIAITWVSLGLGGAPAPWVGPLTGALIMALPYLLLRLLDDFAGVPRALRSLAEAGLAGSVLVLFLFVAGPPEWVALLLVAYFVVLTGYVSVAFALQARQANGVTRSRMWSVALGSACLGVTILAAGLGIVLPALREVWMGLGRLGGLASGVAYFVGFAPPTWLRRAWQEPELRAFLARAAELPRLPDTYAVLAALQDGAARSVGAPSAAIGLWDEPAQVLRFYLPAEEAGPEAHLVSTPAGKLEAYDLPAGQLVAGRAFAEQRPLFVVDVARDDPANADVYRTRGVAAVLAAPVSAGERRIGVLVVYAPRSPIFADSDLELVRLLAYQAAVVLESRALIDEAARVHAHEEATRLKDDFLSSAAHDLRTPLTVLFGQAQVLERRAARDGLSPDYVVGLQRLVQAARHLSALVHELLDASRAERGQLLGSRESVDLVAVAREACGALSAERHQVVLDAPAPVVGAYDAVRIRQLLDNLLENAVKYSPDGGEVRVAIWLDAGEARLSVTDHGIGIPAEDLPQLFERYHRGANVDDRRFSGLGLGLYICRAIAEQHGGRIWARSVMGEGTSLHVGLPPIAEPALQRVAG